MKKLIILVLIISVMYACKKSRNNNCPEPELSCAGVLCLVHNSDFNFRIVDKLTGADLVFGANPRYAASDIRLYFDAAVNFPIYVIVDSSTKSFHTMAAKHEMYMTIGGGSPIKLNAEFRGVSCCQSRVKLLKVSGQTICTCCSDVILIPDN